MKVVDLAVSHLRDLEGKLDSESAEIVEVGGFAVDKTINPATSEQFRGLFEYLEKYHDKEGSRRPVLLHIGCGDGRVGVTATHFDLCSQVIGIDTNPLLIHTAIKLAFEQKVLSKCHFFKKDMFEDPEVLFEEIRDVDIVFVHAFPSSLKKLVPLLAKLSDCNDECKKKKKVFVTLMYHLSVDVSINRRFVQNDQGLGTGLCVYDGFIDQAKVMQKVTPTAQRYAETEQADKEFSFGGIEFAFPRFRCF